MNTRIAPEGASRNNHIHGDEHLARELDATEQQAVEILTSELITERLTEGPRFCDLMAGIDASAYEPYLHRALMNIDNARAGDGIATAYVLAAMWQFANVIRAAAQVVWREECMELAEREMLARYEAEP